MISNANFVALGLSLKTTEMISPWFQTKSAESLFITLVYMFFFLVFMLRHKIAQFRHIKIQPKTVDLSTRLRGINYRVCGVYSPEIVDMRNRLRFVYPGYGRLHYYVKRAKTSGSCSKDRANNDE